MQVWLCVSASSSMPHTCAGGHSPPASRVASDGHLREQRSCLSTQRARNVTPPSPPRHPTSLTLAGVLNDREGVLERVSPRLGCSAVEKVGREQQAIMVRMSVLYDPEDDMSWPTPQPQVLKPCCSI